MFCGKVTTTDEGLKRHIVGRPECRKEWRLMIEEADAESAENFDTQDVDFSPASGHIHMRSSPDVDHNPTDRKNRRVTVEEVDDEDTTSLTNNGRYFEPQPDAGWARHQGETTFDRCRREQHEESEEPWAPFENA